MTYYNKSTRASRNRRTKHVVFDMAASMDTELQPGERAPITGAYEELNIFGTRTGRVHVAQEGDALPPCPRGFSWREVDRSAS